MKQYCYPKNITTSSSINALNIGCGNSDFSSQLADNRLGFNVTSLDFSELLINQMKSKRPDLRYYDYIMINMITIIIIIIRWDVGDMTNMSLYQNDTFDHIYDKGALDALMSTNTNDTKVIIIQ